MTAGEPLVRTAHGQVLGERSADGQVYRFRGLPYAGAPAGELRWRKPISPRSWTTIRRYTSFGAAPVQVRRPASPLFPSVDAPQSEDCLRLNVWSGGLGGGERRPVIVWLYLGAFQFGSAAWPIYDGEAWARAGVVFVSLDYRLSRLGFLSHPELRDEDPDGVCANYGLLDQIAALHWVQENIAAFGGDPGCVTIYGVSAGASSVSLLMCAPAARGLFHRAIAESGGSFGPVGPSTGVGDVWQSLLPAQESGRRWAEAIGAARLRDLRGASVRDLRKGFSLQCGPEAGVFDGSRPIVDGVTLPISTTAAYCEGRQARVPLLTGAAAQEGFSMSVPPKLLTDHEAQGLAEHGEEATAYLAAYPAANDAQAAVASAAANGDRLFSWQNWRWANLHAAGGDPVFYYRFERPPPVAGDAGSDNARFGAFHGASLYYAFSAFRLRRSWGWTGEDRWFSEQMVALWVAFARDGRPAARDVAAWPAFDIGSPKTMRLGETIALADVPGSDRLAFWDRYYERCLSQ